MLREPRTVESCREPTEACPLGRPRSEAHCLSPSARCLWSRDAQRGEA